MTVTYQLTEGEKWKRTLKIEVSQEVVQEKFEAIFKKLKNEVNIPGFRPGHVPMATIRSRFKEMASHDVLDALLDESYQEAIAQSKLEPISQPKITELDFDETKPLIYTAELEVKPVVEIQKLSGFTLKRPDDRVKDAEVNELLNHIQRKHSSFESVDRPAGKGDFVLTDLEVISDSAGNVHEKNFNDVQLELVEGAVASQFMQQLDGVKADSEKEIEVVYPADHFDKRFAGSTIKFKVKAKAVKQLNLIELNEEFFKQFDTNAKTVDEFKEKLKSDIQAKKTKEANDALRDDLIKEVIDKNQFDLPESLLERYLDNVVEDFKKNYKEKFSEEEVRDHYKTIGIRQIRWDFLMNEIAAKENIKVEQQDIDSWLQRFADNYKMTLEEAREQVTKSRRIADLKETILENKVIEFITKNSTVETVEASVTYSE